MAKRYYTDYYTRNKISPKHGGTMTYRIFKYNSTTDSYKLPPRPDVTIPGTLKGPRWHSAALKWAQTNGDPSETELQLMVARFSTRIEEFKLVTLVRQANPWTVKVEDDDDEDDSEWA